MVAAELNRTKEKEQSPKSGNTTEDKSKPVEVIKSMTERHHPYIVELIAKEAGVQPSEVVDFEMLLYDTQASCIGGINNELIFSARLDNLMMSYCGVVGLLDSVATPWALNKDGAIRLLSLFDHEEIGSRTAQGADSNLLPAVLRRLNLLSFVEGDDVDPSAYEQSLATSFLISADMAHSVHPNYPAKYESDHRPEMNKGVVIKINEACVS